MRYVLLKFIFEKDDTRKLLDIKFSNNKKQLSLDTKEANINGCIDNVGIWATNERHTFVVFADLKKLDPKFNYIKDLVKGHQREIKIKELGL
jgi:hypothetical protein